MSRHRLVRQYVGEDSQYYEDEVFGRSVEEDSPLSPSMAQVRSNPSILPYPFSFGKSPGYVTENLVDTDKQFVAFSQSAF